MHRSASVRLLGSIPVLALLLLSSPPGARAESEFVRGDVNRDGAVSVSDALMLRRWLFNGGRPPTCDDSADANDDGKLDVADPVSILLVTFLGGANLPAPFPAVGADPTETDTLDCGDTGITQPEETTDVVRIGDVEGAPGEPIRIPVYVTSSVDVEAFQLVLAYDPTQVEIDVEVSGSVTRDPAFWTGTVYEEEDLRKGFYGLDNYPEQGLVVAGFVPSLLEEGFEVPAGEEQLAFYVPARVASSAEPDTTVTLEPTNGEGGSGFGHLGLQNEFSYLGTARILSVLPRVVGGSLKIVGDQTFFVRGDTNGDTEVDLSDAQVTLGFLYQGSSAPVCFDAADADDNGVLELTDPIYVLQRLYLGGPPIPAPYPDPGRDLTPDSMDCGHLTVP